MTNITRLLGAVALAGAMLTFPAASATADPIVNVVACSPGHRGQNIITPAEYSQVEVGMMRSEVQAIVGAWGLRWRRNESDGFVHFGYKTCSGTGGVVLVYSRTPDGFRYEYPRYVDFE